MNGKLKKIRLSFPCQKASKCSKYLLDYIVTIIRCFYHVYHRKMKSKSQELTYLASAWEAKFQQIKNMHALKVIMLGRSSMRELDLKMTMQFKDL